MREWYTILLSRERADKFIEYVRENNIEFEPSECYDKVHIMVHVNVEELKTTNEWLKNN